MHSLGQSSVTSRCSPQHCGQILLCSAKQKRFSLRFSQIVQLNPGPPPHIPFSLSHVPDDAPERHIVRNDYSEAPQISNRRGFLMSKAPKTCPHAHFPMHIEKNPQKLRLKRFFSTGPLM